MKVFSYRSAMCSLEYKPYVTDGRQAQGAHELFMITYVVVVGQRYYWRASEASETLSGVYKIELIGVDYLSIFHPNNPPLVLGMLVGCVATGKRARFFGV